MRPNEDNINCILINSRSLANKIDEFQDVLNGIYYNMCFDFVFVTETWVCREDVEAYGALLHHDKYDLHFFCRANKRGGGVLVYVNKNIMAIPLNLPEKFSDIELICLDVKIHSKNHRLGCLYRPPNTDVLFDENVMACLNYLFLDFTKGTSVLVGDLNLPGINWTAGTTVSGTESQYLNLFEELHFDQLVLEPTRNEAILDLVLTNDPELLPVVEIAPGFSTSDHNAVVFKINLMKPREFLPSVCVPDFHKADFEALSIFFSKIQWKSELGRCSDVESRWKCFKSIVEMGVDRFVPQRKVFSHTKKRSYPKKIQKLLVKKKELWSKVRKNKCDKGFYNLFAKNCKVVIDDYVQHKEMCILQEGNLSHFYRFVSTKIKSKSAVAALSDGKGSLFSDNFSKAKILNEQFRSVFTSDNGTLPDFERRVPSFVSLNDVYWNKYDVARVLKQMPAKFSRTPDNIPSILLKCCANELSEPLSIIYEKSFEKGILPSDWLIADVCPIFKKDSPNDPANYRPVSLGSKCCQGAEEIIKIAMTRYFTRFNLFSDVQHGFLAGRSTVSQLLECIEDWSAALRDQKFVDIIYLDFAKAFDTVSHTKLLFKMAKYGIGGKLLVWIKSFLSGRKQRVVIENTYSSYLEVTSGVPQGSVLGPLLFLIYINDLPEICTSSVKLFADDVKVYKSFSLTHECNTLKNDLSCINSWSTAWQLALAQQKCEVLHLGKKNPRTKYHLSDTTLRDAQQIRDLGITMNPNFKFSTHCNIIAKKATQRSALLFRVFRTQHLPSLVRSYKAYVRPLIEYGSCVWNPHLKMDVSRLERVQRYFTRRLFARCKLPYVSYKERLNLLNLEPLNLRRLHIDLIQYFKMIRKYSNLSSTKFFQLASMGGGVTGQTRGHPYKIRVQAVRVDVRKHIFSNRAILAWNSLSKDTVCAPSIFSFKKKLKTERLNTFLTPFI